MAAPNSSWDDITTTTLHNRRKRLANNVSNNNALLLKLNKKGNNDAVDGGESIVEEIEFPANDTYKRYAGYEQLDITPSKPFTAYEFTWKQAAVSVSISGKEMLQNSGRNQQINLISKRVKNAERTMENGVGGDIYSDGIADGAKQIGGLGHLLPDDNSTGTVGGIPRATAAYTWNRHAVFSGGTDGSGPVSASNIFSYLNQLFVQCVRGNEHPDLAVADNNFWTFIMQAMQSYGNLPLDREYAEMGFQNVKFMGMTICLDGGYGGSATANHMWLLNTNYIFWRPHKDRNMVPLNPNRYSTNQDAMVKLLGFMGNMTMSAGFPHGLLIN